MVRAPATLQPTVALEPTEAPEDLQPTTAPDAFQPVAAPAVSSFMPPPADISPEAVFDLISAANLQPADEPAPALLPEEPAPAPLPEDEFDLDLDADSPVDLGLGEELDQELEEGEDVDLGDEEEGSGHIKAAVANTRVNYIAFRICTCIQQFPMST